MSRRYVTTIYHDGTSRHINMLSRRLFTTVYHDGTSRHTHMLSRRYVTTPKKLLSRHPQCCHDTIPCCHDGTSRHQKFCCHDTPPMLSRHPTMLSRRYATTPKILLSRHLPCCHDGTPRNMIRRHDTSHVFTKVNLRFVRIVG